MISSEEGRNFFPGPGMATALIATLEKKRITVCLQWDLILVRMSEIKELNIN